MDALSMRGRLVTVREIAQVLSVKESWVYTKVSLGEIPHKKVGRYVRFDVDQVLRWVDADAKATSAARPR